MNEFKIEGWFPPGIFTSPLNGVRYAICGSNWVEISKEMTIDEVMKGWVCTANDSFSKPKSLFPKYKSKTKLMEEFKKSINETTTT
jgi:hypothetical protein